MPDTQGVVIAGNLYRIVQAVPARTVNWTPADVMKDFLEAIETDDYWCIRFSDAPSGVDLSTFLRRNLVAVSAFCVNQGHKTTVWDIDIDGDLAPGEKGFEDDKHFIELHYIL